MVSRTTSPNGGSSIARYLHAPSSNIGDLRRTTTPPVQVFGGDLVDNIHNLISGLAQRYTNSLKGRKKQLARLIRRAVGDESGEDA